MQTVVSRVVQPAARKRVYGTFGVVLLLALFVSTVATWQVREHARSNAADIQTPFIYDWHDYASHLEGLRRTGQNAADIQTPFIYDWHDYASHLESLRSRGRQ